MHIKEESSTSAYGGGWDPIGAQVGQGRRAAIVVVAAASALLFGGLAYSSPDGRWLPAVSGAHDPPPSGLLQAQARIKHVVFVLLENHSFDNIFGRFPGADGATEAAIAGQGTIPLTRSPGLH